MSIRTFPNLRFLSATMACILLGVWSLPAAEDEPAADDDAVEEADVARDFWSEDESLQMVTTTFGGDEADFACKGKCGAYCTCEDMAKVNKAVAGAHKPVFYDNNFDYLCDPCYGDWRLGDRMKRLCFGDCVVVDVGGQYRARQQAERNIRNTAAVPNRLGLTGADDDFLLHRTRLYLNAEIGSRFRFYVEMLDAVSNYEALPPRPIEENRADLQNLFLDAVAWDGDCGTLTARVGRQELLYGAQRLVTPLDWANTRFTYEGAKLMWRGQNWDVDGLWARPMRRNFSRLDSPSQSLQLYGLYSTYKGLCRGKAEIYWLALDNSAAGFRYDAIGSRYYGDNGDWLYEFEGAVQFGKNSDDSDHSAGFFTLGLGRKFECALWKPVVWAYYDWASGDNTVGNGYHHYLPLAHKYNGFMDIFGRRNLEDANLLATLSPHEKFKLLFWYHYFRLQNGNDVPYNVNMTPFAGLTEGSAGSRDLGNELDCVLSYTVGPRTNLLFGYSHFWAGRFYETTAVPYDGDADFFYTQFHVNF